LLIFLAVAALLVVRFLRTGGPAMLRLMNTPEDEMVQHDHAMLGMDHHLVLYQPVRQAGWHVMHGWPGRVSVRCAACSTSVCERPVKV
jgi:hypothetical protein